MFPPFNQEIAHHYCIKTIEKIENGLLTLKKSEKVSEERENQGLMIGSLVCWNPLLKKRVVLLAVSGISRQLCGNLDDDEIIVPPIVSSELINAALLKNDGEIHELTEKINLLKCEIKRIVSDCKDNEIFDVSDEHKIKKDELRCLQKRREILTDESLKNVFSLYEFTRFDGKKISLNQIIKENRNHLPPTGTGDCCAPKLLSYAFKNNLQIVSMDEVYYGKSTAKKNNLCSYPPCDERCGFILPYILGLEIVYRDKEIIVVNKPSGLLSVPGRGEDKQDCVVSRVKALFPECIEQPSVHRLDMETSGLLVLGLTQRAHDNLNAQFEKGVVSKKYSALLDGVLFKAKGLSVPKDKSKNGTIALKFRLDVDNRPHQIYDEENGKLGITEWELQNIETHVNSRNERKRVSRMIFIPKTGRTHQLRLASSDFHGFGLPIYGDSLYGNCIFGERLMLHAFELSFYHPVSGEGLHFFRKGDF